MEQRKKRATITLNVEIYQKAKERSKRLNRNFSNYIEQILKKEFQKNKIPKEVKGE